MIHFISVHSYLQVMVRRIAALPGDDMVSNSQEDEAWQVS